MRRFHVWAPDTCGCKNLYQVFEDDGTWHMASVVEALQVHQERYDNYISDLTEDVMAFKRGKSSSSRSGKYFRHKRK